GFARVDNAIAAGWGGTLAGGRAKSSGGVAHGARRIAGLAKVMVFVTVFFMLAAVTEPAIEMVLLLVHFALAALFTPVDDCVAADRRRAGARCCAETSGRVAGGTRRIALLAFLADSISAAG